MLSARLWAVALISAGTLAYEILLVRAFAIQYFHHFAYMAIGVAMLGFGASGTFVSLLGDVGTERARRWFPWASIATVVLLIASPTIVHRISLDPTQLAWDSGQWPLLALTYLTLALPFGAGALAVLLALSRDSDRPGVVYGASFAGSALGALVSLIALGIFPPERALAVPSVMAGLGAMLAVDRFGPAARGRLYAGVALAAALIVFWYRPWDVGVTPYKGLPQVEAYPGARRIAERTGPTGWVVAVEAGAFRHAPGLSLGYDGPFPRQTALFVDGELAGAVQRTTAEGPALLDWLPSAAAYAVGSSGEVLVLGAGGGTEVWSALWHGAERVTAVELQPALVQLTQELGPPMPAGGRAAVEWVVGDARSYTARTDRRFERVILSAGGGLGGAAAGVHSLSEDFLHTREAYEGYLELLREGGILAVTGWLAVPARENPRKILTAVEALRSLRPEAVGRGIVVMHSWATVTILVRPSGFSPGEIATLLEWSAARRFDLDWYPGIQTPARPFNVLDEQVLHRVTAAAVSGRQEADSYAETYPFDIATVGDARPYPHHFVRASAVGSFLRNARGTWLPFAEWGYVALLATLAQSVVIAALLLLLPAAAHGRSQKHWKRLRLTSYFGAIGLGYLAVEIASIQQLSLLLGHPVYAVTAVLGGFLVFSGIGSAFSDRLATSVGWIPGVSLAACCALYGWFLLDVVHVVQPAGLWLRTLVALLVVAPPALLMGVPFPLGLRLLVGADRGRIAWAWAVNGFASVVAAPLAALVAIEAGSPSVLWLGGALYGGAALVMGSGTGDQGLRDRAVGPLDI